MLNSSLISLADPSLAVLSSDDGALLLIILSIVVALHLLQSKSQVDAEIVFDRLDQEWMRKQAQLDTFLDSPEYIEALNRAADTLAAAAKEVPPVSISQPNHKLPLSVAGEINRMRTRLEKMEEDDIKVRPLTKALERLEEELNGLGYEIVELAGKPYVDGMTGSPQFIRDESLNESERIITRVITPQVLFSGKMVQIPEIEVSTGS
jgi:hypothetical protein